MKEHGRMPEQEIGFFFGFIEIIPGIIAAVVMKKYPAIDAAHDYFKEYNSCGMINSKWKNFPTDDVMQQKRSEKQVKEKEKVRNHGNFT
jgi:hypothetical protein